MSHIVTVETVVRDKSALEAACKRLELAAPVFGKHRLFQSHVEGWAVRLRDWFYPVVCNLESGKLHYDNYEGKWGDPKHLGALQQAYAVEKATLEAKQRGYRVRETPLSDGVIRLSIEV